MKRPQTTLTPPAVGALSAPQVAHSRVAIGSFVAEAEVAVTPAGLLAIGALVSAVLLSVVPIIRAAKGRAIPAEPPRLLPDRPR